MKITMNEAVKLLKGKQFVVANVLNNIRNEHDDMPSVPAISTKRVGQLTGFSPNGVSGVLCKLRDKGYVNSHPNPDNAKELIWIINAELQPSKVAETRKRVTNGMSSNALTLLKKERRELKIKIKAYEDEMKRLDKAIAALDY